MKKIITFVALAAMLALGVFTAILGVKSLSSEPAWAAVPVWVSLAVLLEAAVTLWIFTMELSREIRSLRDDSDLAPEPPAPENWRFIHKWGYSDSAGVNQWGIISNGENHLFFHTFKVNETDLIETCIIFYSMLMTEDTEECRYPWTAENDEILLDALNKADRDPFVRGSFCGEESALRNLHFKPYKED